jgi:hypothetical protein
VIDDVDLQVRQWAADVAGAGATVVVGPPTAGAAGSGVCLYLLELAERQPAPATDPPPLQVNLRYLVTTWDADPGAAHHRLGLLLFTAMLDADYDVELGAVPAQTWLALGVPPQPAFILQVPLRQARSQPPSRYVTRPMVVDVSPTARLFGLVQGPAAIPVSGAEVVLVATGRRAETDRLGRFQFDMTPADAVDLVVTARGVSVMERAPAGTSAAQPFLVRLDLPGEAT